LVKAIPLETKTDGDVHGKEKASDSGNMITRENQTGEKKRN